jgi:hypothetical protein
VTYKPGDKLRTPAELIAALEAGCTVRDTDGDVAEAVAGKARLRFVAWRQVFPIPVLAPDLYPFEVVSVKGGGS